MALFKSFEESKKIFDEKEKTKKNAKKDAEDGALKIKKADKEKALILRKKVEECIITTTNGFEGSKIEKYQGTVSGFAILKLNITQDFFANIGDFWGGKSAQYAKLFNDLQNDVEMKLKLLCVYKGGNAVVGASFDVEFIETATGQKRVASQKDVIERKLIISGSGTAVSICKN